MTQVLPHLLYPIFSRLFLRPIICFIKVPLSALYRHLIQFFISKQAFFLFLFFNLYFPLFFKLLNLLNKLNKTLCFSLFILIIRLFF
jgi:hypothetical protein